MLEKLAALEAKYQQIAEKLADPNVMADQANYQKLAKSCADLEPLVTAFQEYKEVQTQLADAKAMAAEEQDAEMAELTEMEIAELSAELARLDDHLRVLLLPKDPNDEKSVVLEIRAGTGGDEASLFAGDLLKMYTRYAEKQGWRIEVMDASYSDLNGIKEIILMVEGRGVYSRLKFESGVHRVQRVPETESSGRIHTSAATVAVLPEAQDVEVEIAANDVRVDVFCSSGPGGQSVNTTQSAVRITHIPTGIVVSCQDEKSQHKNKDKAMRVLRARLLEQMQAEQNDAQASNRRSMIGSGDRSERIRTYNFPQGRVTDHRIGLTLHKLEWVLQGEIDEIIDALITSDQAERLKNAE